MDNYKACTKCKETKALTDFYRLYDGYQYRCKECIKKAKAEEYRNNPEKLKARSKEFRKANPEKVRATKQKWRANNPKKHVQEVVAYGRRNPDKRSAISKRYKDKNALKYKTWNAERRVKLKNNGVYRVSHKEISQILARPCFVCNAIDKITIDHIIPVDLGGTHSIGNLQPLCSSCNSSKSNRVMTVWLKERRKL